MRKLGSIAAGLVGIAVLASEAHATPTTAFTLSGDVGTPGIYTAPALQTLTPTSETVTYNAGGSAVTDTFTGPTIWTLLQAAGGITTNPAIKNDILRKLVIASGSDGYQVAFSLGELSPNFGGEPILVAYADSLGQLTGSDGFARIVVPGDIAGGRYVSNLASLTVFDRTGVPERASAVLLLAGLAGVAFLRRAPAVTAA